MFTLAAIWGGIFPAGKILLREIGPVTIVAWRTFGAALLLWAVVGAGRMHVPRSARVWIGFAVMGLINNVLPFSLIFWGQQHIEAGLASILNASTAIFGVLAAAIFLADERLTQRKSVGVALGFAGVATAMGVEHLTDFSIRSVAQIALIGATICYALAGVWARKMLHDVKPMVSAAGMLTFSALFSIPGAWWLEGAPRLDLSPLSVGLLVYASLLGTGVAFMLYYKVLALAGSGNLLLVTLLVSPFAIVISAVFLGERLAPNAFAGFALLALGLVILDGRLLKRLPAKRMDRGTG
ncbi:DMT family transporter [Rhodalgimonas zhirmunskyi]|uniref:DMT family transporter n=1 Tax=Rhodalgimonas zhirmunskyi TaxID=2964767 RepID=A0AAJ1U728_9RHOB|nr:DMT family transporter [Rhodoalgimonas zhirmunskyi]MDQ2092850.1 DMT family transporter [Rhodoalgimonas zhirmunskyi]